MQQLGHHEGHIVELKRLQDDLLHPTAGFMDARQPQPQWVCRRDLIISIRADNQEMSELWLSQHILDDVKRRCIEPLQVIKEQHQRMLRPGENGEQTT